MTQPTEKDQPATIQRDVNVKDGDFVGRDKHIHFGSFKIPKYLLLTAIAIILVIAIAAIMVAVFTGGILIETKATSTPILSPISTPTYTPTPYPFQLPLKMKHSS